MDPISGMLIAQGIGGIAGLIAGGTAKRPEMPEWLQKAMMEMMDMKNFAGFMPDKDAFDRSYWGKVDEILATLPVAKENYNAELASRGIHGAGEATKYGYEKVYAPVARATAGVAAESGIAFEEMRQRGSIAIQQLRQNTLQMLTQYHMGQLGYQYQDYMAEGAGRADFWGNLVSTGAYFGLNALTKPKTPRPMY
jgi:hypothetical protein